VLDGERLTLDVVADRDLRRRADVDRIAKATDLAFVVGVGDGRQDGGVVEVFDEFARPDFGDEITGVLGATG